MALVYSVKGDYYRAILNYEQVLLIEKENLGDCKEVAQTYELLGHLYCVKNHYESALDCYQDALEIRIKVCGYNDFSIGDTQFLIGKMYNLMKQHGMAMIYLQKSLQSKKRNAKEGHTSMVRVIQAIGVTHYSMKDYTSALACFEEVVALRRSTEWQEDQELIQSAKTFYLLANTLYELNLYTKAIYAYMRTLRVLRLQFGRRHEEIVLVQQKLRKVYLKQGDLPRATKCYYESIQMKKELDVMEKEKKNSSSKLFPKNIQ